jgi:hypothetical protein
MQEPQQSYWAFCANPVGPLQQSYTFSSGLTVDIGSTDTSKIVERWSKPHLFLIS